MNTLDMKKRQKTKNPKLILEAKWEIDYDGYYPYCTNCNTEPSYDLIKKAGNKLPEYCPKCKAKMINCAEINTD